jgi:hypothetical protein
MVIFWHLLGLLIEKTDVWADCFKRSSFLLYVIISLAVFSLLVAEGSIKSQSGIFFLKIAPLTALAKA